MAAELTPLRGVVGACLTPFRRDGAIDLHALEAEVDYLLEDVDAIGVAAVEAAEYQALDDDTRTAVIGAVVDQVGGRVPVVAGTSASSVRGVLSAIERVTDAGANAAQVLMPRNPWGGQPTSSELLTFFTSVRERSPLPIVVYHNPMTGADPAIATYLELSRIDGVIAFKESSRDITKISRLVQEIDVAGHAAYLTTMQPMLMTLLLGGSGATMPPPGTRIAARIRDAVIADDVETAIAWHQVFAFFPGVWARFGLGPTMKAAMRHLGIDIGHPAPPWSPVAADADAVLKAFITGCGVLDDRPAPADRLRALAAT